MDHGRAVRSAVPFITAVVLSGQPPAGEILYGIAGDFASPGPEDTVLDLYCGTGTIGLSMAKRAGQIVGVETVAQAVEDAKRNAEENGIENARFLCADAEEAAGQLFKRRDPARRRDP